MTYFIYGLLAGGLIGWAVCLWAYWDEIRKGRMIEFKDYMVSECYSYAKEPQETEAKPCPWCGKTPKPEITGYNRVISVGVSCCSKSISKCFINTEIHKSFDISMYDKALNDVIAEWNTRAGDK